MFCCSANSWMINVCVVAAASSSVLGPILDVTHWLVMMILCRGGMFSSLGIVSWTWNRVGRLIVIEIGLDPVQNTRWGCMMRGLSLSRLDLWTFDIWTTCILEEFLVWIVLVSGLRSSCYLLSCITLFVWRALSVLDDDIILLKKSIHPCRGAWIFWPRIVQLHVPFTLRSSTTLTWLMRCQLFLGGLFSLISFNWNSSIIIHCIALLMLIWLGHVVSAWILFQTMIVIAHISKRIIGVIVNQWLRRLMIVWGNWLRSLVCRGNLFVVAALSWLSRLLIVWTIAVCCSHCLCTALILGYFSSWYVNNWRRSILLTGWCWPTGPIWGIRWSLFV